MTCPISSDLPSYFILRCDPHSSPWRKKGLQHPIPQSKCQIQITSSSSPRFPHFEICSYSFCIPQFQYKKGLRWEMKVIANRCVWKLAKIAESDIQRFAGCLGPLGKKRNKKVSRTCRQGMDGIPFISQQQALKSQRGVKPTVKLSAMEKVRCAVYCSFKRSCSHGPVMKPNQTKDTQIPYWWFGCSSYSFCRRSLNRVCSCFVLCMG